ncbi:MAG: ferrous iron transporter B, partial [Clostridia bacterium]|nr:ferrous iron transporter B [Clostridia bacterium]
MHTPEPDVFDTQKKTRRIDRLVANRWLGFPIFILVMWIMFSSVFMLGAYPQEWIDSLFGWLGEVAERLIPDGAVQDLVVNGIIGGVGSVAVFIPQILILYLFISLMEDSGYMARAAFIMDRLMHKMGLHGKSFIPMLMGFGCNVPAIMATRTIESRSSRMITILVTPFMSCSARLPVLVLFAGAFFPEHAALVLLGLYLLGIIVAIVTARLLRLVKYSKDETPFVMELPPYRWPTLRATLRHMWEKCAQY